MHAALCHCHVARCTLHFATQHISGAAHPANKTRATQLQLKNALAHGYTSLMDVTDARLGITHCALHFAHCTLHIALCHLPPCILHSALCHSAHLRAVPERVHRLRSGRVPSEALWATKLHNLVQKWAKLRKKPKTAPEKWNKTYNPLWLIFVVEILWRRQYQVASSSSCSSQSAEAAPKQAQT